MNNLHEFDIIVCGGGAAGCVIAGRLANLDPKLSVLLLEAGENNYNNENVIIPGVFPQHLKEESKTISVYRGKPSKHLCGRTPVVPCANILGGGSSINSMMYSRGSASDYDNWKMKGWAAKDLIPLMRKAETYQHHCTTRDVHGFDGPVKVSAGNFTYPYVDEFMQAIESQGIPVKDDCQDLSTGHGGQHWLKWIDMDTGRRSDAAHAYVHPTIRLKSNLHLRCNIKVNKVVIHNDRAVGVDVMPSKPVHREGVKHMFIRARRQIVLCAGTLSSPLILQRSGVGDANKLLMIGIQPTVDLPAVGLNYQDHCLTSAPYRFKSHCDTFDDFVRGDTEIQESALGRWYGSGCGPLSSNGMDCGTKIRPTPEEVEMYSIRYPSFKQIWKQNYINVPDRLLIHYALICGWYGDHTLMPHNGRFFTMFSFMEYPYSRGHIHIRSRRLAEIDAQRRRQRRLYHARPPRARSVLEANCETRDRRARTWESHEFSQPCTKPVRPRRRSRFFNVCTDEAAYLEEGSSGSRHFN